MRHQIIGFTGTQHGMTFLQKQKVAALLVGETFHHGDCIGSDAQAHRIARSKGFYIIKHPPLSTRKQAFCAADEEREPKPYLERNHDIVDEVDCMLAAPREYEEQLRSGTWATIRYTRKVGKPLAVIYPDGSIGS